MIWFWVLLSLKLVFLGDVMLAFHPQQFVDQYGDTALWRCLRPFIDSSVVIANLEAPLTLHDEPMIPSKTFLFRVPPRYVSTLQAGNIRLVTTANNHILDFGVPGLWETHTVLRKAGIAYVGTGENSTDARKGWILDTLGERIAFLAYSLTFPQAYWATPDHPGTAFGHARWIREDIQKMRQQGATFVVVLFHWGRERWVAPRPYQQHVAHQAIESGADLVVGHHPHVLQPVEIYHGKTITYSLGNGIFGSSSPKPQGALLLLDLQPDRLTYEIVPLEVRPSFGGLPPHPLPSPHREYDINFMLQNIPSWEMTPEGGRWTLSR